MEQEGGDVVGKGFMFMAFMFVIVCIAGSVMAGQVDFARTHLTAAITATDDTITVARTEGFPDVGILVIGDERVGYSSTTATTFEGSLAQPILRGAQDTEAVAHLINTQVTTVPGGMMNTAANYHVAVMADAAGLQAFIAKPLAFFQLIGSFLFLPLSFLGTDLQILTILWAVVGIGMTISLFISLAGGRRV